MNTTACIKKRMHVIVSSLNYRLSYTLNTLLHQRKPFLPAHHPPTRVDDDDADADDKATEATQLHVQIFIQYRALSARGSNAANAVAAL